MEIINLKINVSKITKERLYVGKKGSYLNCSLIPTPNNEFSDYIIIESQTKEERDNKVKSIILGNGTIKYIKTEPEPETT